MSGISINVQSHLGEALRNFAEGLVGEGKQEMLEASGKEVQTLTATHLSRIAHSRHATAQRLGAQPTGHLERAAEAVEKSEALTTTSDAAILTVRSPGIGRAMHDVTIRPTNAKALAIPVHAMAYGRRPRELSARGVGMFVFSSRTTGNSFLALRGAKGEKPTLLYLFRRSVTQQQDRSLLPSDEELGEAAARGVGRYLRKLKEKLRL